jgi:hypothetical protein
MLPSHQRIPWRILSHSLRLKFKINLTLIRAAYLMSILNDAPLLPVDIEEDTLSLLKVGI